MELTNPPKRELSENEYEKFISDKERLDNIVSNRIKKYCQELNFETYEKFMGKVYHFPKPPAAFFLEEFDEIKEIIYKKDRIEVKYFRSGYSLSNFNTIYLPVFIVTTDSFHFSKELERYIKRKKRDNEKFKLIFEKENEG